MIKTVDRYVGRAAIFGTLLVWIALTTILFLLNLMGELRDTQGDYGTQQAFWYALLTVPRYAYMIFPVAAMLGTLVGVGGLAEANELVAFRTAGVSRLRLTVAALGGVLLLSLPVMAIGEWLSPASEHQARAYRLSKIVGQVIIGGPRGMWMRDGNSMINIRLPLLEAERDRQEVLFRDVVIYTFGSDRSLEQLVRAERAEHEGDRWRLGNVTTTRIESAGAEREWSREAYWESRFRPELLDSAVTRPAYLSMRSLSRYISYLGDNDLDTRVYWSAFWDKLTFPLKVIALVMAGMPFVFGMARQQNLGFRLFVGMMLGGLAVLIFRMAESLGNAYLLPPLLGVTLAPLLLLAGGLWALRRSV